jgi:hypothetical protein
MRLKLDLLGRYEDVIYIKKSMKYESRLFFNSVLYLVLFLIPITIYANAGPVITVAPPSYELALLEDCSIMVEREKLTFNMRDSYDVYQINGAAVTADYKMYNPTDNKQSVLMVFPIIGVDFIQRFAANITINGKNIQYEQMYGDRVSEEDQYGNIKLYDYFSFSKPPSYRDFYSEKVKMENLILTISDKDDLEVENDKYYYRMLFYVFTVDFEPNTYTNLSVSYYAEPYSDRTGLGAYDSSRQHYMYILNPAEGWASFNGIDIEVIPNDMYPYLIDGNIDFQKTKEGTYIASYDELPENDLIFTLYDRKRATKSFWSPVTIVISVFIVVCISCIFIVTMIIYLILKKWKKLKIKSIK